MILASAGPAETYTLDQFISMKNSDKITYRNYSILQPSLDDPSIVYSVDNIIYSYMDELKSYRKLVSVSELEKIKYRYKPKLLAYDCYGSTEIYFVLLAINNMCNIKEFDLKDNTFWGLTPSDMVELMNSIYRAEQQHITLNRNTLHISET